MTPWMQWALIVITLILAVIIAVLQMWSGDTAPVEIWAVFFSVLAAVGVTKVIPVIKTGIKRITKD